MSVTAAWGQAERDRLINDSTPEQQWIVDGDGNIVPDMQGVVGVGSSTQQPLHVAIGNAGGLRGVLVAGETNDLMMLIGADDEGLGQIPSEPTRSVGLVGASLIFNSQSALYMFRMPDGLVPESIEGHRVVWGPTVTIDGALYTSLTVGALEPVAQAEEYVDPADYSFLVSGETLIILTNTVVNTYTNITSFRWDLIYANDGDRAADLVVQSEVHRGVSWTAVGPAVTMRLTNDQQLMVGVFDIPQPHLVAGDQIRLSIISNNWAHASRPVPWVRGTIVQSKVHLVQGGV